MVAEGGAGGFDVGRELRFVEGLFGWWVVLLGDNVVDRLFHLLLFFIYLENTTDLLNSPSTNRSPKILNPFDIFDFYQRTRK